MFSFRLKPVVPVASGPAPVVALTAADRWNTMLDADPADADGHAASFLDELCRDGEFESAFQLASTAPADLHAAFFKIIFVRWGQSRPADAFKSLAAITDPALHSVAFRAAADGWNVNDPAGLAAHTATLPPSDDRNYALGAALDNWSLQDPAALAIWLNTLPPGPEFDVGAALMIAKTDGANRSPELAMKWVENITDPRIKSDALLQVAGEWEQADAPALQQYVATAAWLSDEQRGEILKTAASNH